MLHTFRSAVHASFSVQSSGRGVREFSWRLSANEGGQNRLGCLSGSVLRGRGAGRGTRGEGGGLEGTLHTRYAGVGQ